MLCVNAAHGRIFAQMYMCLQSDRKVTAINNSRNTVLALEGRLLEVHEALIGTRKAQSTATDNKPGARFTFTNAA